jgi:hypothetical protein
VKWEKNVHYKIGLPLYKLGAFKVFSFFANQILPANLKAMSDFVCGEEVHVMITHKTRAR